MNQTPEFYNDLKQETREETFINQPLPSYARPF
jgi:hypothetical protein